MHRIYVFMNLQVIQFAVAMWALSFFLLFGQNIYYKTFSASHKLFGCDSTTNEIKHSSLKNKKTLAFINIVFLE